MLVTFTSQLPETGNVFSGVLRKGIFSLVFRQFSYCKGCVKNNRWVKQMNEHRLHNLDLNILAWISLTGFAVDMNKLSLSCNEENVYLFSETSSLTFFPKDVAICASFEV